MPDIVEKDRFETVTAGLKAIIDSKITMHFIEPVDYAGSMTWDDTYRDLDVSANVPSGAKAAMFNVDLAYANNPLDPFFWRAKGGTNPCATIASNPIGSANYRATGWAIVPLNSSRVCQYRAPGAQTKYCYLTGYVL